MSDWISVDDRLPDDDNSLVYKVEIGGKNKWIDIMHLSEHSPKSVFTGYRTLSNHNYCKVTHWQPFPEPPTGIAK